MSSLFDGFGSDGITPGADGQIPVRSQDEINSDPAGSSSTIRRYSGLREHIDALVVNLGIIGIYPYQITQIGDSPTATLTITYAGGTTVQSEPLSIEHIYRTGLSQVPLQEHPNFASVIRALSATQKDELQKFLNGQTTLADYSVPSGLGDFADMIAEGLTSYQRPDPTYTYQARYHPEHNFQPNFAKVGHVYTTAQIIAALVIPPDMSFGLPIGEWLASEVEYELASDGSQSAMQSFMFADDYDDRIYTHGD